MKVSLIPVFSLLFITSCAQITPTAWQDETPEQSTERESAENTESTDEKYTETVASSIKFRNEYRDLLLKNQYSQALIEQQAAEVENSRNTEELDQNINYYVRGLMQDLIANVQYVNSTTPLAVTSFPVLDGDYNKTNLLGKQIAESFMHELHKFGIPVLDFKTTDYIRVTPDGDFILSQDYLELKDGLPIRYVIAGTMVKHQGGYLVNARILGVESKAVVASAQSYIPANVSNALLPSKVIVVKEEKPVISLVKGK